MEYDENKRLETRLVLRKGCKHRYDYQYKNAEGKWVNAFIQPKRWVRPKGE